MSNPSPRQTLLMATHNDHKLAEIQHIISAEQLPIMVTSLREIQDYEEIPEEGETLEENALQKARTAYERHGIDCFADDTGIEVKALDDRPGVYTARYAGEHCSPEDNRRKMLREMAGMKDRSARFRTVIALILGGQEYLFSGEVHGSIMTEEMGTNGFGYDPIFRPEGYTMTFAEISEEEKNKISHRGRAMSEMIAFLKKRLDQ